MNYIITLIRAIGFWRAMWLLIRQLFNNVCGFVTTHKKYFKWGAVLFGFITALMVIFNLLVFTSYIPQEEMKVQKIRHALDQKELAFTAKGELTAPPFIVQAGDKLQIYTKDDVGFFIDGNFRSGAFPPYSDEVFLVMEMPNGKKYRLADKVTRLEVEKGGEIKFSTAFNEPGDYQIFTGNNLKAQRLSEFQIDEMELVFARMKQFDGEVMLAKEIKEKGLYPFLGFFPIALGKLQYSENVDNLSKALPKTEDQWKKDGWKTVHKIVNSTGAKLHRKELALMEYAEKSLDDDEIHLSEEVIGNINEHLRKGRIKEVADVLQDFQKKDEPSGLQQTYQKWFGRNPEMVSP